MLIMPKVLNLYLAAFLLISFSTLSAKESNTKEDESTSDLKSEIKAYILHHLQDSHDFNLLSYKDKTTNEKVYIGMPLPVILWDDGLKIFSSSKLKHGKNVVQKETITINSITVKYTEPMPRERSPMTITTTPPMLSRLIFRLPKT